MRLMLFLLYPTLVIARLLNAIAQRDPLRLRKPDSASFWVSREDPASNTYLSDDSRIEGAGIRSFAVIPIGILQFFARRAFRPAPRKDDAIDIPMPDRDKGIPDEVYTLW